MTDIRLVWSGAGFAQTALSCDTADRVRNGTTTREVPALLCSYYYYKTFKQYRDGVVFRDWSMDSGAYSAFKSGAIIDLDEYIDVCLELLATDDKLTEVIALDVVGDHKAGWRNTKKMWMAGVPAIPVFHFGEPWDFLEHMVKTWPYKIAIGGAAKVKGQRKVEQAREIISRVWPMRVHGLGFGAENALMALPFHSVDTASWSVQPSAFAQWKSFGGNCGKGRGMSVRSVKDITAQVIYYMRMEQKVKARWRLDLADIERDAPPWPLREV